VKVTLSNSAPAGMRLSNGGNVPLSLTSSVIRLSAMMSMIYAVMHLQLKLEVNTVLCAEVWHAAND